MGIGFVFSSIGLGGSIQLAATNTRSAGLCRCSVAVKAWMPFGGKIEALL